MIPISIDAQALENKLHKMEAMPIAAIYSSYSPNKNITDCYFLLTEIPTYKAPSSTILLSKELSKIAFASAEENQIALMSLSKTMFDGTEPMKGNELMALVKTIKKQKSKTPTSLL